MRWTMAATLVVGAALGCGSDGTSLGDGGGLPGPTADDSGGGDSGGISTDGSSSDSGGDASRGHCTPVCGKGMVCDPADNKCKSDGTDCKNVGGTCPASGPDPRCGTGDGSGSLLSATCNDYTNDGFPGGYCTCEACTTSKLCPVGATCATPGAESASCYQICVTDNDCRTPDYGCFDVSPLRVSGASPKICYLKTFACMTNADCPAIKPTCAGATSTTTGACQ